MIIDAPLFAPDLPAYTGEASDAVFNVIPVSASSYGPQHSHGAVATALANRPLGGLMVSDASGGQHVFAGTAATLQKMQSGSSTFTDVSKSGGYASGSSGKWSMCQFGERVIATNGNDAPQSFVLGTDTVFSDLILTGVTALKAKYAAVVKEFVVFGNITDPTDGARPQRVRWSAINDPTNFPEAGTQDAANGLSDHQDVVGEHGELMGIVGNLGTADAALFFKKAVYRMVWSGDETTVFEFDPAEGARGLLAAGGYARLGSLVYYIGEDGFYAFDGTYSKPIGRGKIDRFFYNDVSNSYLDRISAAVDPVNGLIIFAYAGAGNSGGNPNRLLTYSPYFNKWTVTEAGTQEIALLMSGLTFGTTLESLDAIGTLDELTFSLDSSAYSGGRGLLAGFNAANEFGYFDGENLEGKITSPDVVPVTGFESVVSRLRPLVDVGSVTVASAARNNLYDAVTFGDEKTLTAAGVVDPRTRGKYHRFRTTIPAGETWSHFSGYEIEEATEVAV